MPVLHNWIKPAFLTISDKGFTFASFFHFFIYWQAGLSIYFILPPKLLSQLPQDDHAYAEIFVSCTSDFAQLKVQCNYPRTKNSSLLQGHAPHKMGNRVGSPWEVYTSVGFEPWQTPTDGLQTSFHNPTSSMLHPLSGFLHQVHRSEDKGKKLSLYSMRAGDKAAVPLPQPHPPISHFYRTP